ncbi:MAG: bifunctional riboflavin kinase/FAD synthetase [Candidatus Accumulibacter sp.]|jgi:riboflavin kinase/FMN adenylyltransferase|nr:bifunctional riboflavin kinase/FAD synthetase [Accumulibacter sp.]
MFVYRGFPSERSVAGTALAIGNFDGVHVGHRALLTRLVAVAKEKGLSPAVLTFEPHPREFFEGVSAPPRLSTLRQKLACITAEGVECAFVRRFDRHFAALSADDFVDRVLVEKLHTAYLIVGGDFRFGAGREGNFQSLRDAGRTRNFEVEAMSPVMLDGEGRVSSSAIRKALQEGKLNRAGDLLGRPYSITGRVIRGAKRGREMGAATANIRIRDGKSPLFGVFAVEISDSGGAVWRGVANLGFHPSVDEASSPLLEAHLFDFSGDLYGRRLTVSFIHKIRDEIRFSGLDSLKARIADDIAAAKRFFQLSS